MIQLPFTKMHGLGNDFVVLDNLGLEPAISGNLTAEMAKKICDRRFGIGADQILWLKKAHDSSADFRMEILNADGSVAEMCGNGIRAVALYAQRHTSYQKSEYKIETLAGLKTVRVRGADVTVDMGLPILGEGFSIGGECIEIRGEQLRFFEVNVGNPHAVFFVDEVESFPVEELGPLIEKHPRFPHRTNVEFVKIQNSQSIQVRVWERGAGITLACGTGACASAVASLATHRLKNPLNVELPGGRLRISWEGNPHSILMEGPATEVFKGTFCLDLTDSPSHKA
jgi:diaminopimelate epimerase